MDSSLSLSTSCRILTICSSLNRAVSFVQQIRSSSGPSGDIDAGESQLYDGRDVMEELNANGQVVGIVPSAPTSNEKAIPWMISNKYYSARVHFLARTVKGLAPFHFKDVPAVIFVWRKGSAYKHHIQRICQDRDIDGSEPEVSLAVRIDFNKEDVTEKEEQGNDEEDEEFNDSAEIDEFLSSKGFEFIDIPASFEQEGENEILADAIPSLPRVLDALSTIMWPSMQSSVRKQKRIPRNAQTQLENHGDGLLDWAHNSLDQSDIDIDSSVVMQTPTSRMIQETRMRKEMEELRQWLEEDHDLHKDDDGAWGPTFSHTGMSLSPTEEGQLSSMQKDGFDDDFTVFVSAPPEAEDTVTFGYPPAIGATLDLSEGEFPTFASFGDDSFAASFVDNESADAEMSFDSLVPSTRFSSVMYHSLGSASELGDGYEEEVSPAPPNHDRDVSEVDSDDSDNDLPTESEVRASAQKIFGRLPPPSSLSSNAKIQEEQSNSNVSRGLSHDGMNFDLTHMVSAIQGMKAEISGMDNEDERRNAAARVALGLVYGLDRC